MSTFFGYALIGAALYMTVAPPYINTPLEIGVRVVCLVVAAGLAWDEYVDWREAKQDKEGQHD